MSIKPILFNTDMVWAIQDGRKTVTRRAVKPQPSGKPFPMPEESCWPGYFKIADTDRVIKPPYMPGDILWVRETWAHPSDHEIAAGANPGMVLHRADNLHPAAPGKWRPSIHMPRNAARIFLRVKSVRAERLNEITNKGARDEGCDGRCLCPNNGAEGANSTWTRDFSVEKFITVWESTIKHKDLSLYGWDANPPVLVNEFERCKKPEGWC